MRKRSVVFAVLAASLFVAGNASAELVSSRDKPFYIEGSFPLGFSTFGGWYGCGGFGCAYSVWKPDIELGFHFTGRHDGFVLGIRHVFYIGGNFGMAGLLRIGYDIPIPIKGGKYEVTIGPYGLVGGGFFTARNYTAGGLHFGGGAEGKFFLIKGFYVFARPLDFGAECIPDAGGCFFQWQFGAGAGYAW